MIQGPELIQTSLDGIYNDLKDNLGNLKKTACELTVSVVL